MAIFGPPNVPGELSFGGPFPGDPLVGIPEHGFGRLEHIARVGFLPPAARGTFIFGEPIDQVQLDQELVEQQIQQEIEAERAAEVPQPESEGAVAILNLPLPGQETPLPIPFPIPLPGGGGEEPPEVVVVQQPTPTPVICPPGTVPVNAGGEVLCQPLPAPSDPAPCPPGSVRVQDRDGLTRCEPVEEVPPDRDCPPFTRRVGDLCLPVTLPPIPGGGFECPPGTARVGDACVLNLPGGPAQCPPGWQLFEVDGLFFCVQFPSTRQPLLPVPRSRSRSLRLGMQSCPFFETVPACPCCCASQCSCPTEESHRVSCGCE